MTTRRRLAWALPIAGLLALLAWGIWSFVDHDDTPDDLQQVIEDRGSSEPTQVPGVIEDPDGPTPEVTPPPPPPDQDGGEDPASQVRAPLLATGL